MLLEAFFSLMFFVLPLLGMLLSIVVGAFKKEKEQRKEYTYLYQVVETQKEYFPISNITNRGVPVEGIDTS